MKKEHGGSNPLPNAITAIVKKDEGVSTTMLEKFLLENNIPEKIFSISEIDKLNEDLLWEMSVVKPRRSGLPYKIWLDPMGVTRGNEHTFSPRLKVEVDGNFIPVEISDNPKIPDSVLKHGAKEPRNFSKVYNYIKKYKDIFLAHFYGELDENEVLNFVGKESEADSLILKFKNYKRPDDDVRIVYHYDTSEMVFVVNVVMNEKIIYTDYILDRGELFKEANRLKRAFEASGIYEE